MWPSSEAVLSLVFRQTSVSMSGAGQTVDIKLSRSERQPWGFRLHGGADFGAPLIIQKVSLQPFFCLLTLTLLWLDMKNWISWIKLCEILKFNLCKFWSSRLHIFENINIYYPLIIKFSNVQVKLNDQFKIGSSDIQDIMCFKTG